MPSNPAFFMIILSNVSQIFADEDPNGTQTFLHPTSYTRYVRSWTHTSGPTQRFIGVRFQFRTLKPNASPLVRCEWSDEETSSYSLHSPSPPDSGGVYGHPVGRRGEGGSSDHRVKRSTDQSTPVNFPKSSSTVIISLRHGTLHISSVSSRHLGARIQSISLGVGECRFNKELAPVAKAN